MPTPKNILISWEAPEYRHYPKNMAWYVTCLAVIILFIVYLILQKDLFGAISIGIIAIFILWFSRQAPAIINIALDDKAVWINEQELPYKNMRHFWIVDNNNHKTLNVETTAYLNNLLIIELEDQDPDNIRTILANYVPEHSATEETFAQRMMHRLKF